MEAPRSAPPLHASRVWPVGSGCPVPPPLQPRGAGPLRLEPKRRPRHGPQPRPALESPQCVRLQAGGRRGRGTAAAQRTSHARVRLRGGGRPACERHDPAGRIARGERRRPGHRDPVIAVHSLGVMPGGRALHPRPISRVGSRPLTPATGGRGAGGRARGSVDEYAEQRRKTMFGFRDISHDVCNVLIHVSGLRSLLFCC